MLFWCISVYRREEASYRKTERGVQFRATDEDSCLRRLGIRRRVLGEDKGYSEFVRQSPPVM